MNNKTETVKILAMQNFGGNQISHFNIDQPGRHDFIHTPYFYFSFASQGAERLEINKHGSFSVYCLQAAPGATLQVDSLGQIHQGDVLVSEGTPVSLNFKGIIVVLVAGTDQKPSGPQSLFITKANQIKKVTKPWGLELWLNGEHPGYALKHIQIDKGFRTSLQYHHFKQETNVLLQGRAKCSFKKMEKIPNDSLGEKDISYFEIEGGSVLDIMPQTVHRLEALTDLTLCEVSTPHLDDVVRLLDDAKRGHGRIEQEHQ